MTNPFVITEIGLNANGDINLAKQLIDMAKEAGADAVKFQKRTIDKVYSKEYLDSPRESPWGTTQRAQKLGLEFGREQYDEIDRYCRQQEIDWFASAWDIDSQWFLEQYHLKYNKIASPMIRDQALLNAVARENIFTFISTGMALKSDIDNVVALFNAHGCPFMLLHCVNKYPCPDEFLDMKRILWLKETYKCSIGYSNHSVSLLPSLVATMLGAEAIEIHITLDRASYGSDQAASFEKTGLERVVRECQRIKQMLK